MFPAVGAFLLATQTGCIGSQEVLGVSEKNKVNAKSHEELPNNFDFIKQEHQEVIDLTADEIRPYMDNRMPLYYNTQNQKIVLFIPKFHNNETEPNNNKDSLFYSHEGKKGEEQILDDKGSPIGYDGLIFCDTNKHKRVVKSDGKGVIIIDHLTEKQVEEVKNKIKEVDEKWSKSAEDTRKLIHDIIGIGINNLYPQDKEYVDKELTKTAKNKKKSKLYSVYKNNEKNGTYCRALYIGKKVNFIDHRLSRQTFENGVVILKEEGNIWGVEPRIFKDTYVACDSKIKIDDLPTLSSKDITLIVSQKELEISPEDFLAHLEKFEIVNKKNK